MEKRFLTGLIIGFSALFAVLSGGVWLAIALAFVIILGAKEYTEILQHKGFLPSFKIIIISSIMFGVLAYFNLREFIPLAITLTVLLSLMTVLFKGKQPYIANVATTIFGAMYCSWFPVHMFYLRNLDITKSVIDGTSACIVVLFAILVTDIFCYFAGIKYGKHKLSPVISPNKTIEGSIGGSLMCMIFTLGMGIPLGLPWYHALIIGGLIAVFSQIGDLCESMIKRDAGVKDSSNLLPGHGGFLDRTDSYILTIPIIYYYIAYIVNTNIFENLFRGLF